MNRFATLLALVLFTLGCNDSVSENDPTFDFNVGQIVAFESIKSSFVTLEQSDIGNDRFTERENRLFTDQQAFQAFWDDLHGNVEPKPALPQIDFESEIVIAVLLGLRNSGGYAVSIERVVQQNDAVGVEVKEEIPGATCSTATVMSSPYHIIKLRRLSGEFIYVNDQQETTC